ncbi:Eco57I restriction-modification methylase domain-containing protein [Falseniella ignava]|uniref:Eco57I restriction-modification methylase domain-containing protein n=1 Tax=Falseniella ignava TaxID=137730 RepID=UPI001C5DC2A5|nr:Eco57I restriction-modification methylase domain-containing protein [Falseniella ignava]
MEALKRSGISFAFSKLFEPESITLDKKKYRHKKFINEREILDLLQVIDGSKEDDGLLGFLDYDKIKSGKMCRHIVMVLPYCASCDAMEDLIKINKTSFKNLNEYEIINISGLESSKILKTPNDIKNKITECESNDIKTITLTVNRMLTGSTVEQWDTMLYLKDTASPQEYDQSIFRLQNQYIRTLSSDKGTIRENLKPQTLLVDFDPNRLFRMQEQKSLIYNVNTDKNGNSKLLERIQDELHISPIIVMNHNKIKEVTATNILEYISEYNNQRSVSDEVLDIPVDLSLLNDEVIRTTIESQGEFNSKQGLTIPPNEGEGDDIEPEVPESNDDNFEVKRGENKEYTETKTDKEIQKLESKIKTYYQRILFFSFLTKDEVSSLDDILSVIESTDNERLSKNLLIDKYVLEKVSQYMDPFKRSRLDYKIQNISLLANDETMSPIDRAMTSIKRFNRMSESEVVTPAKVCDDMINLLPENNLREIVNKNESFLDIGCKSGEYVVSIYNRLRIELGLSHDVVKDLVYSIPTSSIAYEFTRKFYEILDLNIENIATNFNAYDLLEIKNKENSIDYEKIKNILEQDKKFCNIKLDEKIKVGDNKVKFGAVVGNPPYQLSDGGAQASAKPIYQHFVLLGKELTNKYTCFITPTRWFAGGKGLNEFRDLMLKDRTMRELHDFTTPEDVFPNTNNRGGVCFFINDKEKSGDIVRVVTYKNDEVTSDVNRTLLVDGIDIFIRDGKGPKIIEKVNAKTKNKMSEYISSLRPFGFRGYFTKDESYHVTDKDLIEPVLCYGKRRQIGYVEKELINKNTEYIDVWKVFIARANNIGTELSDDNLNAFIGKPKEICTETYLVVGAELNLNHKSCENLTKYFKTKFARYMHSLSKPSQDSTAKTFRFVPIQDFTDESDIDWTKVIDEIDEQLFDKYQLTEEERNHIKNSIKDM